jgi:hypothetical protein
MSAFNGLTLEAAVKLSVDASEHLSANLKLCLGCHGFEADMAYVDLRVVDELNFRLGRFSPSFGSFNLRHDPANHKLSDKPLPYDMGRMLRKNDWNLGVLPSPFPDNGVEIDGTHWVGDVAQLDYAIYGVQGFRNTASNPTDIDFAQSHFPYYYFVQDAALPAVGARIALTVRFGTMVDGTLGASGMYGTYDPKHDLTYAILGGDFGIRVGRTNLRLEYLVRRTAMDMSDPTVFKYPLALDGRFFAKHGGYAEIELPLTSVVDLVARVDGLERVGNVPTTSPLTDHSWVSRETLGFAFSVLRNFRAKTSVELWQFSDADAEAKRNAVGIHLAGVASF